MAKAKAVETPKFLKGTAKEITTQFGKLLNFSLSVEQIKSLPVVDGYVQFTAVPRKTVSRLGSTHAIKYNDYLVSKQ